MSEHSPEKVDLPMHRRRAVCDTMGPVAYIKSPSDCQQIFLRNL